MARPRAVAEIEVTVIRQSIAAVLVSNGTTEVWVPHSLIDDESEIDDTSVVDEDGVLVIPKWKAEELELE